MRICNLGVFDNSGYGHAMVEYTMSMAAVGVDVVPRYVKMSNASEEIPPEIEEWSKKDLNNVDAVFQYNLPDQWSYKSGVKNIGGYAYETNGLPNNGWRSHLELMDSIVVLSTHHRENIEKCYGASVGRKTFTIPCSLDTDKFNKEYRPLDFNLPRNCVKFYTIGEFTKRKNYVMLISAYITAFTSGDPVVLIIKTNSDEIKDLIANIKKISRKYINHDRFPKIIIINSRLSEEQICSLHKSCDVFISASRGEACCIPALDALGFGNPVVVPNHTAFRDYMSLSSVMGLALEANESPVMGEDIAPMGLYTNNETWYNIDMLKLAKAMKLISENIKNLDEEKENRQVRSDIIKEHYSRKVIGNKLLKALSI